MANPSDTFSELSFLTIQKKAGTPRHYETIIETIDISGGEKGVDYIATIKGGRLKKFNPQEPIEVTIEGYAVEVGTTGGASTGTGFYDLLHSVDTSQPMSIPVDHARDETMIAIMATDNLSQSNAVSATTSTDNCERWVFKNGHVTNVTASFTDKVWKFTLNYSVGPFDKTGTANVTYESSDGNGALSAVTYSS